MTTAGSGRRRSGTSGPRWAVLQDCRRRDGGGGLAAGELVVRLTAHRTPRGLVFANTVLLSRSWSEVAARNAAVLERLTGRGSYLVPDGLLGWVIGPNRRSADGLYSSSVEGVRSARVGEVAGDRPRRHRVALVGDSFSFGLDVSYEDSWGYRLERSLGSDVQVLNFGVEAYGADQAYLRYVRDVRPWRPEVVILGLIDHDLYRSMAVYFFVSFPGWDYPFAKPRFVVDAGYRAEDWQRRPLDRSYLHRLMVSKYRDLLFEARPPDEAVFALNREILRSFMRQVRAEGSSPSSCTSLPKGTFAPSPGIPAGGASPRRCSATVTSRIPI